MPQAAEPTRSGWYALSRGAPFVFGRHLIDPPGGPLDWVPRNTVAWNRARSQLNPERSSENFLVPDLASSVCFRPRVIDVDGRSYRPSITELKHNGEPNVERTQDLDNVVEQNNRFGEKRIADNLWYLTVDGELRTIAAYRA